MDNKYVIIAALISLIGTLFEPKLEMNHNKPIKSDITNDAEHYIDSIRLINDSLLHGLKMENKALIKDKIKLEKKVKRLKHGKIVFRQRTPR